MKYINCEDRISETKKEAARRYMYLYFPLKSREVPYITVPKAKVTNDSLSRYALEYILSHSLNAIFCTTNKIIKTSGKEMALKRPINLICFPVSSISMFTISLSIILAEVEDYAPI